MPRSRGAHGAVNHIYDPVGNRKQMTSTLPPVPAGLWNYDANGNRVGKTAAGVTTTYLVDTRNSTGYAQVLAETISGPGSSSDTRTYTYGLELISQHRQLFNGQNFTQTS